MTKTFPLLTLTGNQLATVASYDEAFIAAVKAIGAKFTRIQGKPVWYAPIALKINEAFMALVLAARARAETADATKQQQTVSSAKAAYAAMTTAQKAAEYDRGYNEGGDGYNPYRNR